MLAMARPKVLLAMVLALWLPALSGCSTWEMLKPAVNVPQSNGIFNGTRLTDREKVVFRSDFSVELNQFADQRTSRSLLAQQPKGIIYQYDPDDLLQGVTYRLPVLLETYLTYRPRKMRHYHVDVAVTELQTYIKTGNIFDGRFGRYAVRLELAVVVRRPDSRVVLARSYRQRLEATRSSYDGRNPTLETDRAAMFDLVDTAMRKTAENIGWDIRRNDYLRWDVQDDANQPAAAPLPTSPTVVAPQDIMPDEDAKPAMQDGADAAPLLPLAVMPRG
jgi:hypothetical protein